MRRDEMGDVGDEVGADTVRHIINKASQGLGIPVLVPHSRDARHGKLVVDDSSVPCLGALRATLPTSSIRES